MNDFLDNLVKKLKSEGKTDQEIEALVNGFLKEATERIYDELEEKLTDDDLDRIEAVKDNQEKVNLLVKDLYKERTGKEAEEFIKELLPKFLEEYLDNLKK